ncbi:MAG TPA: tRNA (adenosine(37)-N6)-threonylcarbamoyltransferase complex dimerization subunit type 1 TsaB [Cytophagales bacterium]|nr:tRNA (adenosine(37)-N6)-threonylcarbamoyltransferase complex dimerization subunit type 1 TsaB [Cytophagales bacterium]HAP64695.1 tRNA (adenosine(37)-N6)-threonylcarbamoyltransferase complex dimerization subunit type 1 TsaB [Cytophagales bacterium]
MALILSIDTSTPVCSVALHRNGQLVSLNELFLERTHASHLTLMIDQVLANAKASRSDISAIAVSEGPGSYTGLRIGASTAKGMAFALGVPIAAVPTLSAMARTVSGIQALSVGLCPMLDARRMEVYCQLYKPDGRLVWDTQALVVESIADFEESLDRFTILFFGDGAPKLREILQTHPNAHLVDGIYPSAKSVGELAWDYFQQKQFVDVAYWEPFYLKEFQAGVPKRRKPKHG